MLLHLPTNLPLKKSTKCIPLGFLGVSEKTAAVVVFVVGAERIPQRHHFCTGRDPGKVPPQVIPGNFTPKPRGTGAFVQISHRILLELVYLLTFILLFIVYKHSPNVGKYSIPMDPLLDILSNLLLMFSLLGGPG